MRDNLIGRIARRWSRRPRDQKAGGNQWLFGFLAGLIGGMVAVVGAILLTPFLDGTMKVVSNDSAAGFAATVFGGLAALLGVAIAVVVAIQWVFMEHKVAKAVDKIVRQMREEIGKNISSASTATSEYIFATQTQTLTDDQRDNIVKEAIRHYPGLFNAATNMSLWYVSKTKHTWTNSLGMISAMPPNIRDDLIGRAEYWANEALRMEKSNVPGYPNLMKACVLALQKEPRSAMEHLQIALRKGGKPRQEILSSQILWDVLTGMTHGGKEGEGLLKRLLEMLGMSFPSKEEIIAHCDKRNRMGDASFDAVRRDNGDAGTVTVRGIDPYRTGETTWSLFKPLTKDPIEIGPSADASKPAEFLLKDYILTRIKPIQEIPAWDPFPVPPDIQAPSET